MDEVRIRAATHDDIPRLQEVEVAAGAAFREVGMVAVADDPPPSTVVLAGFVQRGQGWVLTGPAGDVRAYLLDDVVDGDAHLEQVSLDPAWSGRGLGRRLIDDLLARSRRAGFGAVTLTTYRTVPWNGPYYARLGFRGLDDDELGPGLRAIRRTEAARGLDRWPRCAMRRDL